MNTINIECLPKTSIHPKQALKICRCDRQLWTIHQHSIMSGLVLVHGNKRFNGWSEKKKDRFKTVNYVPKVCKWFNWSVTRFRMMPFPDIILCMHLIYLACAQFMNGGEPQLNKMIQWTIVDYSTLTVLLERLRLWGSSRRQRNKFVDKSLNTQFG